LQSQINLLTANLIKKTVEYMAIYHRRGLVNGTQISGPSLIVKLSVAAVVVIVCLQFAQLANFDRAHYLVDKAAAGVTAWPTTADESKGGYITEPSPKNGTDDPRPQPTHRGEGVFNLENYTSGSFLHTVDNYFELTQQNRSFFPIIAQLPPLEVMRVYIQEHSQQRLEKLWRECGNQSSCETLQNTQFIVGRYSCPIEAGNRLMRFMNGLVWAIATGKTFLWGHFDEEACHHMLADGEVTAEMCEKHLNSQQDCAKILHLADWVPSWEKWSVRLNLTYPVRASALGKRHVDAIAVPMDGPAVPRVVRVGQQNNLVTGMVLSKLGDRFNQLLQKPESRIRTQKFLSHGHYFAYGMLFESLFTLDPSLVPSDPALDNNRVDTYMLHSRHQLDSMDGSELDLEVSCMNKVISNRSDSDSKPCVVYTMTDRMKTREKLPEALLKFKCASIFTDTIQGASFSTEHGPFAGRGYFQDLALVRQARRGFMSPNPRHRKRVGVRTSSALPRSIIEFRRVLESPSYETISSFEECITW
jgi:hypothetical protein